MDEIEEESEFLFSDYALEDTLDLDFDTEVEELPL